MSHFRPNVGAGHPVMRLQSKLSRYVLVVGLNRMHRRDDTQEKGTARWLLSRKLFGVLTKGNGHLESKRLEGRVCLRDADITTKISLYRPNEIGQRSWVLP